MVTWTTITPCIMAGRHNPEETWHPYDLNPIMVINIMISLMAIHRIPQGTVGREPVRHFLLHVHVYIWISFSKNLFQGLDSLEKSLNSIFPWKVLKFLCKSLKSPWIFIKFECSGLESVFWCFVCLRQNVNHSSENLKVIYVKCSMLFAIINCRVKTRNCWSWRLDL